MTPVSFFEATPNERFFQDVHAVPYKSVAIMARLHSWRAFLRGKFAETLLESSTISC